MITPIEFILYLPLSLAYLVFLGLPFLMVHAALLRYLPRQRKWARWIAPALIMLVQGREILFLIERERINGGRFSIYPDWKGELVIAIGWILLTFVIEWTMTEKK